MDSDSDIAGKPLAPPVPLVAGHQPNANVRLHVAPTCGHLHIFLVVASPNLGLFVAQRRSGDMPLAVGDVGPGCHLVGLVLSYCWALVAASIAPRDAFHAVLRRYALVSTSFSRAYGLQGPKKAG